MHKTVMEMLDNMRISCTKCGKETLKCIIVEHVHYFRSYLECPQCNAGRYFDSADKNINKHFIDSCLLSGIDYVEYSRLTKLMGMNVLPLILAVNVFQPVIERSKNKSITPALL